MQSLQTTTAVSAQRPRTQLSKDVFDNITTFLEPKNIGPLFQTSRCFFDWAAKSSIWKQTLTPDAQKRIDKDPNSPFKLFRQDPEHRRTPYRSSAYFLTNPKTRDLENFIIEYIRNEIFTVEDAQTLTPAGKENLQRPCVLKYMYLRKLTLADAVRLNFHQKQVLDQVLIQEYIDTGKLTVNQVLGFDRDEINDLDIPAVYHYIQNNEIDISTALILNLSEKKFHLNNPTILKFIHNNLLPFNLLTTLTEDQLDKLLLRKIREAIQAGRLTVAAAVVLTPEEIRAL